jgi:2-oxoisovalerate dehydrogenase E1 component
MKFDRRDYDNKTLLTLYEKLLWPRMIEEKMLVLLRQGKISKWFSGIGQEAISVGATMAMQHNEWIMPLHRNLGVFTSRDMPLHKLFKQWQGSQDGYSKGRERSFHFGNTAHHICGMISHLGPQLAIADGVALAYKLNQDKVGGGKVSLTFTGDGGTSEGDFHEALNVAAVWGLPVIFIIENNGYGLSTPVNEQYKCESLVDRAKGYGMEGIKIDGNNILEVYDTIKGVRDYCATQQKPYLIECMTFRMRGHEEASGVKYVPPHLFDEWQKKDPIHNYEQYLTEIGLLTSSSIEEIKIKFKQNIEAELEIGFASAEVVPNTDDEIKDVYAPSHNALMEATGPKVNRKFFDAITDALDQSMERYDNLVLMGQDIAEYGGAFKITEGLLEKYGKARVRNTPLCESAIIGTALGLSLEGYKSMVEMQFADFVSVGLNQIVNNLAKIHYRWGQNADVVVRMPTGAGVGAGPFHSQSNEAWFIKTAGLKVVYPSNAYDAKGLLNASISDPNPVLFFEHKALYRSISGDVPSAYYELPIGKAAVISEGTDACIITYGMGVHWATALANDYKNRGYSIAIVDLRSLAPIDYETIKNVVNNTGKVLVLTEDNTIGSLASEVAAWIGENCFAQLDAPVMRCGSLETPIPFNTTLEKNFLANARLAAQLDKLLNY